VHHYKTVSTTLALVSSLLDYAHSMSILSGFLLKHVLRLRHNMHLLKM